MRHKMERYWDAILKDEMNQNLRRQVVRYLENQVAKDATLLQYIDADQHRAIVEQCLNLDEEAMLH